MARGPAEFVNSGLYAAFTVRQEISGREGLRLFREAGGHISNARWFALVGSAREAYASRSVELAKDVNAIPSSEDITTWENLTRRGYYQQVNVIVRDRATGEKRIVPYTAMGRVLRSRKDVIQEALDSISGGISSGNYEEDILGALYVGTYTGGSSVR